MDIKMTPCVGLDPGASQKLTLPRATVRAEARDKRYWWPRRISKNHAVSKGRPERREPLAPLRHTSWLAALVAAGGVEVALQVLQSEQGDAIAFEHEM